MKIKGEDFLIESCNAAPSFFDVSVNVKVNAGKENERIELQNIAYGVPILRALEIVAHSRAELGNNETLDKYIADYKEAVDQLILLSKHLNDVKEKENSVSESSELQEMQDSNQTQLI